MYHYMRSHTCGKFSNFGTTEILRRERQRERERGREVTLKFILWAKTGMNVSKLYIALPCYLPLSYRPRKLCVRIKKKEDGEDLYRYAWESLIESLAVTVCVCVCVRKPHLRDYNPNPAIARRFLRAI